MSAPLSEINEKLLTAYGPPEQSSTADDPFAILVDTILAQGTSRAKAELALTNLRDADLLDLRAMQATETEELQELIRPAGNGRLKAARLRRIVEYLLTRHDGSLTSMLALSRESLRSDLLAINGIGPETADAILLHVARLPVFVVDGGVHRIWKRHGWIEFEADSEALQQEVESSWDVSAGEYSELNHGLNRVSQEHCRSQPQCDGCPLAPLLPEGGPLGAEW